MLNTKSIYDAANDGKKLLEHHKYINTVRKPNANIDFVYDFRVSNEKLSVLFIFRSKSPGQKCMARITELNHS
jgi:hypothetical protein